MSVSERTLLGPGPSNPYPEATLGLAAPLLGHLDPEFITLLERACGRLRSLWGTENPLTLPLSGTGSLGMETAFANTVRDGDVVVVAVNGLFGERMCEVAGRYGAEVVRVDHEWGRPVDVQRVLDAHPAPRIVAAVHAETSTGVVSDIGALGRALRERSDDTLLLADCVTSLGGMPMALDEWKVDIAYSGTQKCLGVAPGLAPFTFSERAWERRVQAPPVWYVDLGLLGAYVRGGPGGRAYHHTAPTAMVASLDAGLARIEEEGLEAVAARHEAAGARLREGLLEMGLELFAAEGHRLSQLTSVRVPEGVDSGKVRERLLREYGLEIGAGVGPYAATVWRIGLMGHNARLDRAELALAALRRVLDR
ncbi:MAG: alanine--glyoxylate aminotransferase family protein [Nocardiopsis sp. BM-2018]|uniref:Alanine-glyoxylate transaminase/serine-glyoxylate transaminase/serine-pyruvate transaminase n=1 Tax=Nocardiopsis metallicus TaxID=179819 RepID=A0A840WDX1_9ACTN|nr:alanine--glyoxylate aminotransferase family protein [Nocardiopsis metallicus]MBB5489937.1 alanine-glyoxylate transaminase/serine-glyoxylate transaminase/serine-pyruvate transaminase [Nocardiopsis metallicus]QRN79817.1 MAG: alanine--glyoxylate aminotransferase family protein [Nocardiopsis sp. BM-2018]